MITRREIKMAFAGIVLLIAGAWMIARSHGPMRDTRSAGAAVRILQPTRSPQIGAAVVLHGLSANRIIMQNLGQWLAAQGFRVYLVDAPGHGDTPGHFSNAETLDSTLGVLSELLRSGQIDPQTTIFVGHSMGGEIAIRLADYFPAVATVALSPAPMILPRRVPFNLLVIGAQFDLPPLKEIAERLVRGAHGPRISPDDFRQRHAAEKIVMPWDSHGSLIMNSRVFAATAGWARMAIGLTGPPYDPPGAPLLGEASGIAGLVLLFPMAATLIVTSLQAQRLTAGMAAIHSAARSPARRLLYWGIAAIIGVGAVSFWDPQRILPLYTGGYLVCFLLITGVLLLLLLKPPLDSAFHEAFRAVAAGSILAILVVFFFGAWVHWQLSDVWIHGTRWFYLVPLLLMSLPYLFAEELALGPPDPSRRMKRWGMYFLLRLILWLALLSGILVLWSGQVLLALLAPYFLIGSLGQRLGADWLRRHTGSPAAAAIFSAILAAWFMAAVFPLA